MTLPVIDLQWRGPLKPGTYPANKEEISAKKLTSPGVYLYLQRYPQFTGVYVGRATDMSFRIRVHLGNFLGFRYALRHDDPSPAVKGETAYCFSTPQFNGFHQFNDLSRNIEKAIRDVNRLEFYYFPCDTEELKALKNPQTDAPLDTSLLTKDLEALLIRQVRTIQEQSVNKQGSVRILNDNLRQETPKKMVAINEGEFHKWLERKVN